MDINFLQAKILIERSVKLRGGLCHIEIVKKEVREENPREEIYREIRRTRKDFHKINRLIKVLLQHFD